MTNSTMKPIILYDNKIRMMMMPMTTTLMMAKEISLDLGAVAVMLTPKPGTRRLLKV